MKPNGEELAAIAAGVRRLRGAGPDKGFPLLTPPAWPFSWPAELREIVLEYLPDIAAVLHEGTTGIFLTLGAQGALYCSRDEDATGSGQQQGPASAAVGVAQGPSAEPAARRYGEREVLVSLWHTPAIRAPVVSLVGAGGVCLHTLASARDAVLNYSTGSVLFCLKVRNVSEGI